MLALTTSFCASPPSRHVSQPIAKGTASQNQQGTGSSVSLTAHSSPSNINQSTTTATTFSSSSRRVNIPYFTTAVPFNQTAIFWFGDVTATDTFTDVRMGYNSSELYIDLRIFDSSLWYDPNTAAPNLSNGDNASIYLNTTSQGDKS
jgi:hypothetical protein